MKIWVLFHGLIPALELPRDLSYRPLCIQQTLFRHTVQGPPS